MNEMTNMGGGLIGYLHQGGNVAPVPFEQEIYLFRTRVAGASYVDEIDTLAAPLKEGDPLELLREPDNAFDRYAILVRTANGQKIRYVPRCDNLVFARLMDAGKYLFARVKDSKKMRRTLDNRISALSMIRFWASVKLHCLALFYLYV